MTARLTVDVTHWGNTVPRGTPVQVLARAAGGTARDTVLLDDGRVLTVGPYEWEETA